MRKIYLSLFLLLIAFVSKAQTVDILNPIYGTSGNAPMGTGNYAANESIYTEAEVGGATSFVTAGTAINRIAYNVAALGTPTAFGNVKIYMKDVPAGTTTFTTGTYTTTGYTLVFSGTYNATATGWNVIDLATPYVRTAGTNLQVLVERFDNATHTGFTFNCTNTAGTNMCRRANQVAVIDGTTSLPASAFRPSIRLVHAIANDAELTSFTSVGKFPVGYGGSQAIVATVTNVGTTVMTNIAVNLNVTGANTYSNSQNIASLAAGATTTVTFSGYIPTAIGTNSLAVSLGADGNAANNSLTQNQVTTSTTYALSNNDAFTPSGSIGFNTGSGNLLVKMPVYKACSLTGVRVSISADAAVAGNAVYGVLLSSTGTIIAQSPNYTIQNSDLGQYVTFNFAAAQALTPATTYYIGLGQTANTTTGYYPVNTQSTKTNLSHSTVLAGGTVTDYTTFGSLMIEGNFATSFPLPVTISSFTGVKEGKANRLTWSTSTEVNNKGFDLERSADGRSFSSIGFVATKADNGNSAALLNYSFIDEKALAGTNYYRLKQTDRDGKFTYSSVVVLKGDKGSLLISSTYPNPAKDQLNLAVISPSAEKATLVITDLSGKVVAQLTTSLIQGENNVTVNVSGLSTGTYSVRLMANGETQTTRFVKN